MARQPLPYPLGTIEGTTPVSGVEPPGQAVGTRFFGFDETLEADKLNRAAYAIMENLEFIYNLGVLIVVAPAGGDGDYVGHDALQNAITDGHRFIYVKAGAYSPTADIVVAAGTQIIGDPNAAAVLNMAANKLEFRVTGDGVRISSLSITLDTNDYVRVTGASRCVLDRLVVVGAILVNSASSEVRLEGCSVTAQGGGLFALSVTSGRATVDNCYFYSSTVEALVVTGASYLYAMNCQFISTDKVADISAFTGNATFTNCTFANTGANPNYSTAFLSFVGPTSGKQIQIQNCLMTVTNCIRGAAVAPYITLDGVSGRGLRIGANVYYADDYLLRVSYGTLEDVEFSLTATPLNVGAVVRGAIHITTGGTIRDLSAEGMTGTWSVSVVHVASTIEGVRAVLDGITFSKIGANWANIAYGLAVSVGFYGVLRRLVWDDVLISNATTSHQIVGVVVEPTTPALDGVEITDCVLVATTATRVRMYRLLLVYTNAGASDAPGINILRNRFHIAPVQPDTALVPTYTINCVQIGGHSVMTGQNDETGGNLYGHFCDNYVHFDANIVGSGASNLPSANPVFFAAFAYMWVITGNIVVSKNGTNVGSSGFCAFIACYESSGGLVKAASAKGGGNVVNNNVLREVGGLGQLPSVASPDGYDGNGFFTGTFDLLNVRQMFM